MFLKKTRKFIGVENGNLSVAFKEIFANVYVIFSIYFDDVKQEVCNKKFVNT